MEMRTVLLDVIAAVLLATTIAAHAEDDSDPRWNMWMPELKEVTVLREAWVFKNDCHRKMKDHGEDEALSSALDYMADRHPDLYRHAQVVVHPFFVTLTKSQQKRYCDAAWRKLDGIASKTR
jgi:hypothetical protein